MGNLFCDPLGTGAYGRRSSNLSFFSRPRHCCASESWAESPFRTERPSWSSPCCWSWQCSSMAGESERLPPKSEAYFFRWALNIGELRHATLPQLSCWTGWLLIVSPALLLWHFWKARDSSCAALAALLLLLTGLSLWHMRWGYFLAIAFALSLPWALAVIPWKPVAWLAFVISLWPVAGEWDRQLYPDEEGRTAREEDREDAFLLRETAQTLISPERTIILAPWWLSPRSRIGPGSAV